jgi:hypothetical protein
MRFLLFALLGSIAMSLLIVVARHHYNDYDSPIDISGRTSIVIDFDNGDWAEIRGPGRFRVLDEWSE